MIKMSYSAIVTAAIATGFTVSAAGANAQTAAPDTIYFNGKIVTVDRQFAIVEAVAVTDGKFSAVGKSAAIRKLAGPNTRIVNLGGREVLPGLIDAHPHTINGHAKQEELYRTSLHGARSAASTQESPFVKVMEATHISGAASAINFVVLIAALSAMNSQMYTATRMIFSLARGGQALRWFGVINSRGVPTAALGISTTGIAVAAILNVFFHDIAFEFMNSVLIFGGLFAWLMIFVTHIFFRMRSRQLILPFRMWGYPLTPLFGAGIVASVLVTTWFTLEFKSALLYGIPFLAVLVLAYLLFFRLSERRG